MTEDAAERWARLRFAIIGKLLVKPPEHGELKGALEALAGETWEHPTTGEPTTFGESTIERWYYQALGTDDPIRALRRQIRSDAGANRAMSAKLLAELEAQYRQHPKWSYQLHSDNLKALVQEKPSLGRAPSYTTVRRSMKKRGWRKQPRARTPGQRRAQERLEQREVRSYEVSHVHGLWHFDYHEGKRQVIDSKGRRHTPYCLGILDDLSRLGCHVQWYLQRENTETLSHGLIQAFLKRRLPRGALSDNGSPMLAEETQNGFEGLSIKHETTLANSPYQNGKQEAFWEQVEGRLMPMLESVEPLSLTFLNYATQAWLEQEYNRSKHDELGISPLEKMLAEPDVSRPCPPLKELRLHFTVKKHRTQRRSDGTISIAGVRFEVPSRFRHVERLSVRYARWDLSSVYLVDPRDSTKVLAEILPQDKRRNADRQRRVLEPVAPLSPAQAREPVPPLMRKLLADYAATGLPPAYIPHIPNLNNEEDNHDDEHNG